MDNQLAFTDHEDSIRLRGAWDQVLRRLRDEFAEAVYNRFFVPLKPTGLQSGHAQFDAPGAFVFEWVRDKHLRRLEQMLGDELGEPVRIDLKAQSRARPEGARPSAEFTVATSPIGPEAARFRPIPRFKFDSFVVGPSNRLAFAGTKAVADRPGDKFNPLFIYGTSGLGKTHLLHAIAHQLLETQPKLVVHYASAQHFAEEFVHALQNGKIDQFRRSHRNVGMWLIDDIQFVVGKERTQEEVFHTFNFLQSQGKQIVITSDKPPRDLFLVDERLRSRFESGLVADIQPPDTETRCAILLSKAAADMVELDHETAIFLAEHVPGNVRLLEGALTKLAAQASLEQVPITRGMAEQIVERYYRHAGTAKPNVTQILNVVGKYYSIPVDELKGSSRKAPIAHARHVAVYIARAITGDSWKHLGSQFGQRDHTSMMHAYQKINEMMAKDQDLTNAVRGMIRNLNPDA